RSRRPSSISSIAPTILPARSSACSRWSSPRPSTTSARRGGPRPDNAPARDDPSPLAARRILPGRQPQILLVELLARLDVGGVERDAVDRADLPALGHVEVTDALGAEGRSDDVDLRSLRD